MKTGKNYSDYIVYVDESGDHGLVTIDPQFPVFVLAFCIFHRDVLTRQLTPALQEFKFRHFGHDQIVLHERDIRKDMGKFSFLKNKADKDKFINELAEIVAAVPFTLITTVIRKPEYLQHCRSRNREPDNPYHVALGYGLERVFYFLRSQNNQLEKTHVIVEARGKHEDDELELEFRRICDGANYEGAKLPFEVVFVDKKSNSEGLQLADLIARPVGVHILHPGQLNRAYEILEAKFYRNGRGQVNGWGLKCFP